MAINKFQMLLFSLDLGFHGKIKCFYCSWYSYGFIRHRGPYVNIHDRRDRTPKYNAQTVAEDNQQWHYWTHHDQHAEDRSCTTAWPVLRALFLCPKRPTVYVRPTSHTISWIKRTFARSSCNKWQAFFPPFSFLFFPVLSFMTFANKTSRTSTPYIHGRTSVVTPVSFNKYVGGCTGGKGGQRGQCNSRGLHLFIWKRKRKSSTRNRIFCTSQNRISS